MCIEIHLHSEKLKCMDLTCILFLTKQYHFLYFCYSHITVFTTKLK
jgi:hypothetical protein